MISTFQNDIKNTSKSSDLLNELRDLDLSKEIALLQQFSKENALFNSLGNEIRKILGDAHEKDKLLLNQREIIDIMVGRLYVINVGLKKLQKKLINVKVNETEVAQSKECSTEDTETLVELNEKDSNDNNGDSSSVTKLILQELDILINL